MRSAFSVAQIREAEAALMARLPEGTLMQRAAAGLAAAIAHYLGGVTGRRILLLIGPGDNGGDALFAGARLAARGAAVSVLCLADTCHAEGMAALRSAGGATVHLADLGDEDFDLVVDGIVGIGGRPGLRDNAVAALQAVAGVPMVAVDVPSGVDVDTGAAHHPHVRADLTVTFGAFKPAHFINPAATACGALDLVDIGLGPELHHPRLLAPQAADIAGWLRPPVTSDHKYSRGVVGVRAGSAQYPGAALLAVAGANCGLTGMVRYLGPPQVAATVHAQHPEVVGEGKVQAWTVGSGTGDDAESQLSAALADGVPLVVDADALLRLSGPLTVPAVLTPHAGELARMLATSPERVEAEPLRHVTQAADRYGATVLLKGAHTLIAGDQVSPVLVNTVGSPWLATAGSGDVLAGLIGALLATGLTPLQAAAAGAWLHGSAGVLLASQGPFTASLLPGGIRRVLGEVFGAQSVSTSAKMIW